MRYGTFLGKRVKYRPGLLWVCTQRNDTWGESYDKIQQFGGKIVGTYNPNVYEVKTPFDKTIEIAEKMNESGLFRFVEVDRVDYY